MKKLSFALITLLSLAACSDSSEDLTPQPPKDAPEVISLSAAVMDPVVSRAPINSDFTDDFPIGIYAHNGGWKAGTNANLINNDKATVSGEEGHDITFGSGTYYYPADGSLVNFFGFAPRATETKEAGTGTAPTVSFSMTGQEDIMHATAVGSKAGSILTTPEFNFTHKLTQLQFAFKSGANYPATGYSVVSLTVNSQPNEATMDVGTGVLIFSGSADMQALSDNDQTTGIAIVADPGSNTYSPVMTEPAVTYNLTVVVRPASGPDVTYSNISVLMTAVAGTANAITLTFTPTGITATASVADWLPGASVTVPVS